MHFLRRLFTAILIVSATLTLSACKSVEERAEGHYQSALSLVAEGDIDRAIVELRNVFELNESHTAARRTMAELLLERGDRPGAYRQYLFLAEQDPDDLESRIILTELAFLGGNWEEVDRHGARAAELAPEDPRVQAMTLVRDYRKASREDGMAARRELGRQAEAMVADQPENVLLRNILVDYAVLEQDYTRALAEIDWVIDYDPTNSRNYQERMRILAQSGDMEAVEEQLRDMIRLFPNDPTHQATLIRFYLSRNDLDSAEAVLRDLAEKSDPEDPAPTLDLIRFLAELRGLDAARVEIEKAIAERPNPARFQTLAASLDFTQGRRDEAIETLQGLLEDAEPSEENRDIKITLAKMLLATGNEVGARARVEEVLAEQSTHPQALKMQAAWQIEADDTDAALSGLRLALDQSPEDAEAMTLMADAYARAGQATLAKDFLAQAVEASGHAPEETLRYARLLVNEESYLPAEDILLSALRLARTNIDLLAFLGDLYLRMEDYGRAQGVADALRRLDNEVAIRAANGIEAERLNQERGVDAALTFLEGLATEEDATLATRIALVRAQMSVGDTAGAIVLAEQLRQENPENEAVGIVLAVANSLHGNLDQAISIYRDLLETNPARPDIWMDLSRLHRIQGDREIAKATIEEGLSHTPDAANLLWAEASFRDQDGDIDGAIAIYERLYAEDSNSPVIANNLASMLTTHRDDAESLERAWIIARRLRDAEVPQMQDTYGWILHRRGNTEQALPYLEDAAEGLPNDPLVQYHLGQIYNALDRPQDALEQFRTAIEIAGPADNRPQIEEARSLIQSLQNAGTAEN
ncbi:tetratricopeptide repeat protein [Thalassococcus sp. BH17M4-6]|uniref:tetratricopeptide repeat protein n=1 Tax=Thalassococcus sp. BH17M4-6 TaxID=3413148 RepID=UPI003BEE1E20